MAHAPAPEFSRAFTVDNLADRAGEPLTGEADAAERAALARRFAVPAVRRLHFELKAEPTGPGGWRVSGTVEAGLTQTCVVTLEPVETEIAETVERRFVPRDQLPPVTPGAEMELDSATADGPDGHDGRIDLGEIAAEAVALAIDPYPRHADADFASLIAGPAGAEPLTDEAARPFAGLAALKDRQRKT
jgi:uncharacterized metal-binding protein YceD (DUF177 family)